MFPPSGEWFLVACFVQSQSLDCALREVCGERSPVCSYLCLSSELLFWKTLSHRSQAYVPLSIFFVFFLWGPESESLCSSTAERPSGSCLSSWRKWEDRRRIDVTFFDNSDKQPVQEKNNVRFFFNGGNRGTSCHSHGFPLNWAEYLGLWVSTNQSPTEQEQTFSSIFSPEPIHILSSLEDKSSADAAIIHDVGNIGQYIYWPSTDQCIFTPDNNTDGDRDMPLKTDSSGSMEALWWSAASCPLAWRHCKISHTREEKST